MTTSDSSTKTPQSLADQRALWRKQAASLPPLGGGKGVWVPLTLELVEQIGAGKAIDMTTRPELSPTIFATAPRQGGATPLTHTLTWLEYSKFVRGTGLAHMEHEELRLTPSGQAVRSNPTAGQLASVMTKRFRLFTETLSLIAEKASTVEEVDDYLRDRYEMTWKSLGGARRRMDWLEVLSLIEGCGNRRWRITEAGESLLAQSTIVTPQAISIHLAPANPITEAPDEIKVLLDQLSTSERSQDSRSTYNIWVPSPASNPNKVANLRTIVNAAIDPITREELLRFIAESFGLRRSSVDSMMPFLRASGLLHEIGLGIYQATAPARAWVTSEDDVNFIRILHANMRFVGEMIRTVEAGVTRSEMYCQAAKYGLNVDKSRWIASFLEDTALIEQPRYGSLRATAAGLTLVAELPLAETPTSLEQPQVPPAEPKGTNQKEHPSLKEELTTRSRSPQALGQGSGKAFENSVCDAFRALGFSADTVSGAGDTDVVVRWHDETENEVVAIVEAKSRSNGHVTHTDISDIALESHKFRHKAHFAALVGPAFHGDTIKNMAVKREWALVDAARLGDIVEVAAELGLGPKETGILFKVPNGLDELDRVIERRRRELSVLSFVIAQLAEEAADTGDAITARDISRDGRRTELTPTADEVLAAFSSLSQVEVGALRMVEQQEDPKFSTYALGDVRSAAMRLRALANAIEISLPTSRQA
ncbi:restriction endonuclease [Saccharopolyspora spinosa]|uniref:Restriction endonuclease n=1 Tax=Saccharopolyspora spinosa TaxID=60894 RepID=A0A2N3XTY1_SACSN|nr:restriction endonuclease [Saccharopolyspora spinosa]PKW14137.1 restriction endonuclease [Saccharopolyspora spinosa]